MSEETVISQLVLYDRNIIKLDGKITRIEEYDNGEWFWVWEGEHLKCKFNNRFVVAVYYK